MPPRNVGLTPEPRDFIDTHQVQSELVLALKSGSVKYARSFLKRVRISTVAEHGGPALRHIRGGKARRETQRHHGQALEFLSLKHQRFERFDERALRGKGHQERKRRVPPGARGLF